jgi:hypothetical protein
MSTDTATAAAPTPEQARAACDHGMHTMGSIRWLTTKAVSDLTGEQWMRQVSPGTNHILFNVGHLAAVDASMLKVAGGPPLPPSRGVPESYEALFAPGCKPSARAADYPDPAEVLNVFGRIRQELLAHLSALPAERLLDPVPNERLAGVCPTLAHLPGFLAMHEGTHAGQILLIRRSLGLPGVLGM